LINTLSLQTCWIAKGKTKFLTSEAVEKNASVDPQHQVTTNDANGKGLIKEGSSSG